MENHAKDIKLSSLSHIAAALGKKLHFIKNQAWSEDALCLGTGNIINPLITSGQF